ncbi:hypothetical protein ACFV3E_05970 [Streptomyces sp. NPDC059718]
MTALEGLIVASGPERIEEVRVHEGGVIEAIATRPLRVFERQPNGSLEELHGDAKTAALEAFWASVTHFNEQQEQDR